jgi:hypothetical protein
MPPPFVFTGREVLAAANITAQSSHHTLFVTQTLEISRKIMNGKVKAVMIIISRTISALRDSCGTPEHRSFWSISAATIL